MFQEAVELQRVAPQESICVGFKPEVICLTDVHGDERRPGFDLAEYLSVHSELHHVVHIPNVHPAAQETQTRGAILDLSHPIGPGMTKVYVREDENGIQVSENKPNFALNQWKEKWSLDFNRMHTRHSDSTSLSDHADHLYRVNNKDPRVPFFRKLIKHPIGIPVSIHVDNEQKELYLYASATAELIEAAFPTIRRGMGLVQSAGVRLFTGIDAWKDSALRRLSWRGIIKDAIHKNTPLDGTIEKWLAWESIHRMMADATNPLHYPLVLTIELPGRLAPEKQNYALERVIESVVLPTMEYLFPNSGLLQ